PEGFPGPARLVLTDQIGQETTEAWDAWNPWPAMVAAFEAALTDREAGTKQPRGDKPDRGSRPPTDNAVSLSVATPKAETAITPRPLPPSIPSPPPQPPIPLPVAPPRLLSTPAWQDEIRSLELDDAVRRSVARRRASTLEYQDATEEASFKGAMTLVGC